MNTCPYFPVLRQVSFLSVFLSFLVSTCVGAEMIDRDKEGRVEARYQVSSNGKKHGAYEKYYSKDQIWVRASYRDGELDGQYKSYYKDGKPRITARYAKGLLHGKYLEKDEKGKILVKAEYANGNKHGSLSEYVEGALVRDEQWSDGVLTHPKSEEMIRKTLAEIYESGGKKKIKNSRIKKKEEKPAPGGFSTAHIAALKRLQAYRYLCDVPWKNLQLDVELNSYAEAAAAICDKIGHLDHTPKNPGMPEEAYRKAYHGTSHSNLSMGSVFATSVDRYMYDSDQSNIDRVGHRRWSINPPMLKVGFGASGRFGGMMCMDASGIDVPDYDYVCYPPRGYLPVGYIGAQHAWCISLNPAKYQAPDKGIVKVKVTPRGKSKKRSRKKKSGDGNEVMEMDYFNINNGGFGIKYCIIFRCKGVSVFPGTSYDVVVEGVKDASGKEVVIRYVVDFVSGP